MIVNQNVNTSNLLLVRSGTMQNASATQMSLWLLGTGVVSSGSETGSPSTYSMTMHKWRLVSKEQYMLTTKGFSAKVRIHPILTFE